MSCKTEVATSNARCYSCTKIDELRERAFRFYLGHCYAEQPAGYEAALAWYMGELGEPPTLEQAYELGKKLLSWGACDCARKQ